MIKPYCCCICFFNIRQKPSKTNLQLMSFCYCSAPCKVGEHRCSEGKCISVKKLCDNEAYCHDASDEDEENCRKCWTVGCCRKNYALRKSSRAAWPRGQRVGLAIQLSCVRVPLCPLPRCFHGSPRSNPRPRLEIASWIASDQLGFLTMLCSTVFSRLH